MPVCVAHGFPQVMDVEGYGETNVDPIKVHEVIKPNACPYFI